jgi:hypothetical protein
MGIIRVLFLGVSGFGFGVRFRTHERITSHLHAGDMMGMGNSKVASFWLLRAYYWLFLALERSGRHDTTGHGCFVRLLGVSLLRERERERERDWDR